MLEHEQKKCMENDRDADSPGTYQRNWSQSGLCYGNMCSILSFQNLNRERWKYQKRF